MYNGATALYWYTAELTPIDNNYFEAHKSIIHNYVHIVFYSMLSNWLGQTIALYVFEGNYNIAQLGAAAQHHSYA